MRGFDIDGDALARAAGRTELAPVETVEDCVAGATLVFVCTPIPSVAGCVRRGARLAPEAVVTDVGEREVSAAVRDRRLGASLEELRRYVGGHPMGGSERSGPEHASPSVLDGIVWVLDARADGELGRPGRGLRSHESGPARSGWTSIATTGWSRS